MKRPVEIVQHIAGYNRTPREQAIHHPDCSIARNKETIEVGTAWLTDDGFLTHDSSGYDKACKRCIRGWKDEAGNKRSLN